MNAALELIRTVESAGGSLRVIGDRLRLAAPGPLPGDVIERLREAKGEIVSLLTRPIGLPPALVTRDGRRWYRLMTTRGTATPEAERLVAEAKAAGCALVAESDCLGILAPMSADRALLTRISAHGPDVLATLHRHSDKRLAIAEGEGGDHAA